MELRGLTRRFALPTIAAGAFLLGCLVYWLAAKSTYFAMLNGWGVVPGPFPFLDTHMVLSSRQCSALGIDPFVTNPCDALGRPFLYAPVMLWGAGPHEVAANAAVGLILAAGFVLSLLCLPAPRARQDLALMIFAILSPAVAFAVERGNFELLIFILAAAAGRLLLRSGIGARLLAYGLMLVAALCKFFPAVLFALTLRERPRLMLAVNTVAGATLALVVLHYYSDLKLAAINLPQHVYFGDMFGAITLPYGLAALIPAAPSAFLMALLVAGLAMAAVRLGVDARFVDAYGALADDERLFLAIGSILMVGAFFAGQSVAYRAIHLLFVLPGLSALARPVQPKLCRWIFTTTTGIVLFLLWGEFFHVRIERPVAEVGFWLLREAGWWWLTAVLAATLLRFTLDSAIGRLLLPPRLALTVGARSP